MRYFQTVTAETRKCNNLRVSLTVGRLTRNSRKALPFSTLGRILYNLYNQTNRHQLQQVTLSPYFLSLYKIVENLKYYKPTANFLKFHNFKQVASLVVNFSAFVVRKRFQFARQRTERN